MSDPSRHDHSSFSLVQGGAVYRVERRFRLTREGVPAIAARSLLAVGITFVPLAVLAAIEGVLFGGRVTLPLLSDWTVLVRLVFAIPLLLNAEAVIDRRLSSAVTHFRESGLLEGKARDGFEEAIGKLSRSRDSFLPEAVLMIGAFAYAWLGTRALALPVSSWWALLPGVEASTTMAGRWLDLVSLPIFNFLVFRWLWRIFLWSRFLYRVSRLELRLVPTHPDGAAGLGFLGGAHTAFGAFLVPMSATVAARGVQWVQYGGGSVDALRNALIAFAVIALLITLGPLLVFTPRLTRTKHRGLLEYGVLASDYTRRFEQKWLRRDQTEEEELLGTGDIQSLADLGNSYSAMKSMKPVPVNTRNAVSLLLATALPMLPLLAAIIPIERILKQLLQLVMR